MARGSLQSPSLRAGAWLTAVALTLTSPALPAWAQEERLVKAEELFVGSEAESYLRTLQTAGVLPLYPWSIRGFSFQEISRLNADTVHPWSEVYPMAAGPAPRVQRGWVAPHVGAIYNTTFPYGFNNGPIWAGRGATTSVRAGLWARVGPLSLVLAPMAFRAENDGFEIVDVGATGDGAFADARRPGSIDLPQRFGDRPYARVDPGESSLRLDLPWIAAGVSTANQHWGPATEFPILLGNNAPGFLHGFVGTGTPTDLWIGRVHGRAVWGALEQSAFSWTHGPGERRFMSGLIAVFVPRGIPGLELGGGRFFHTPWPENGLATHHFTKPFEGLLKRSLHGVGSGSDPYSDDDNQLASVFFRWVLPREGFELFGEFGREDHNWDVRDFLLEPDHDSSYLIGFQKVWTRPEARMLSLKGELMNARITHLLFGRHQEVFYVHTRATQGHTHRGQVLGAVTAYGGGGSTLAADWYHPGGKRSLTWTRVIRGEQGDYWRTGEPDPRAIDVMQALGVEALVFRRSLEVSGSLIGVYQLNRNFREDAFNLNAGLSVRWRM